MEECFGIIYKAENKINGKVYVGQTTQQFKRRITGHCADVRLNRDNSIFHKAIKKYGFNNFEWEILECCDSKEEMDEMEFHYIKQYKSFGRDGYNLTLGGEGSLGYIKKLSEEHKRKISISVSKNHFHKGKKGPDSFNSKKYVITTPDKDEFVIHGLAHFCRRYKSYKLLYHKLSLCAQDKRNHHKYHRCRYYNEEMDGEVGYWEEHN